MDQYLLLGHEELKLAVLEFHLARLVLSVRRETVMSWMKRQMQMKANVIFISLQCIFFVCLFNPPPCPAAFCSPAVCLNVRALITLRL